MMKRVNSIVLILMSIILLTSCNKDDINQLAIAPSQLCSEIVGPEGLYWDILNGVIRTDLPGGIPPQVDNIGGSFSHVDFPLLSFIYPVGWTPEQLRGNGTVGVNLLRNDNEAFWRYASYLTNTNVTVRQIRDFEIQAFQNFETVCINQQSGSPAQGIFVTIDNIMLRSGDKTAMVIASLTFIEGSPTGHANVRVAIAPTVEFNTQIFDTFLAIDWQLLIGDPDSLYDGDRDNDGTPDVSDNFPDDPTRA